MYLDEYICWPTGMPVMSSTAPIDNVAEEHDRYCTSKSSLSFKAKRLYCDPSFASPSIGLR